MRNLLVIASLLIVSFTSCKNEQKNEKSNTEKETREDKIVSSSKRIVGKWKPVDFEMKEEKITPDVKKMMLDMGNYVEFTSSGHYTSTFGEEPEKGTYTFNEKTNELRTVMEGNSEQVDKVKVSWEGDIMVVEDEEGIMKLKRF